MAYRVGRGIALLFHDLSTRRWVSVQQHAPAALYLPRKTRYPFYRRLGGPQGRSERTESLVPTGIRSRTAHYLAQSLYRLSYPAHNLQSSAEFKERVEVDLYSISDIFVVSCRVYFTFPFTLFEATESGKQKCGNRQRARRQYMLLT